MAKDFYHENVRKALEKDGWRITHDPYPTPQYFEQSAIVVLD